MFLLILESIGTPELILIAVVALILFGPRKLPQMAKTVGKTMADFRNATNEFKTTWQREAQFEDEKNGLLTDTVAVAKSSDEEIKTVSANQTENLQPKVRELSESEIEELFKKNKPQPDDNRSEITEKTEETTLSSKRDWL